MLKESSIGMSIIINILIICLWHFLTYIISGAVGLKHVNYRKFPYRIHKFEKMGKFYRENFDIEAWYRLLPIKYNNEGIDARAIEDADIPTVKNYITYTCRSEMCSLLNSLYLVFAMFIDVAYLGFIIGVIVILCNLPFIAANRYARCGLLKEFAKKRKQREILEYIEENNPDKYDLDSF